MTIPPLMHTGDPVQAIARRYLGILCACMTPNSRCLSTLSEMLEQYTPDAVIDFVLTACHSSIVESYTIGEHVTGKHGLPFLTIDSDYSDNDEGQIRTKIETLFEMVQ